MRLRNATMDDADFLLKLKNDPVMRKFAVVTHGKIKKADHIKWLKKHLGEISIITEKGKRLGMFRIAAGEVSINLDPVCRGRGIGNKVLKQFCPKGVWAKIVNGNVPSMKIFLNNGFKITGYMDNYYVLQN
jgi:RimJ/RimL family protein N-acetyltransferase